MGPALLRLGPGHLILLWGPPSSHGLPLHPAIRGYHRAARAPGAWGLCAQWGSPQEDAWGPGLPLQHLHPRVSSAQACPQSFIMNEQNYKAGVSPGEWPSQNSARGGPCPPELRPAWQCCVWGVGEGWRPVLLSELHVWKWIRPWGSLGPSFLCSNFDCNLTLL